MGTELYETLGYWDPRFGWDLSQNKPTAGEYQAIGLDLQGSSPEYAAKLQAELEATKAKLESGDEAQLADLFKQMIGNRLSAMEHLIPEQMFSTEEAPAQGISAVKAIALASAQGQKIWTITRDNLDAALAAINLNAESETEILNSVNAGSIVTTHERSINFNGWVGEGYIIIDPTTGAGAYKIAGGGNGSEVITTTADVINWISFAAGLKVRIVRCILGTSCRVSFGCY